MDIDEPIQPESEGKPMAKGRKVLMFWLHVITFVLGLALLGGLVWYIGWKSVIDSLSKVGWGFVPIIGLNVLRHFMRSGSMYLAIPKEHRNFKYREAVAARFGGEAVTFLTFTGPFLGDATKAVLLRRRVAFTEGASAVLIDNVLYYVSVVVMIILGVFGLVYVNGSGEMRNVLIGIVVAAALILVGLVLAIRLKIKPVTALFNFLERRSWLPAKAAKIQQGILQVETNVFHFYEERPRDFFLLFLMSCAVHFVSVCEVFLSLKLLGFEAFWSTAFIIESLTKVINVVFGFIPGTIGVYEGGNGVILLALGYTTAVGISLALVRRGAIMFSLFVGLAILLWRVLDRGTKTLAGDED